MLVGSIEINAQFIHAVLALLHYFKQHSAKNVDMMLIRPESNARTT